jgi:hypothetical protein
VSKDRIRLRDESQDIGAEDWHPVPDSDCLVAGVQARGCPLPRPRHNGSDQAGGQGKPAGKVPKSLRGQEFVIECYPVEHLIEQPWIAASDPDGEEDEGLGINRPSIGSSDGR